MKKGQALLKEGTFKSTKRNLECLGSCDNLVDLTEKTTAYVGETTAKVLHTAKKDEENIFKKFSFLNRDKSYMSRLSSYVSKNISNSADGNTVQTKSIVRASNMYFTSVAAADVDDAKSGDMQNNAKFKDNVSCFVT